MKLVELLVIVGKNICNFLETWPVAKIIRSTSYVKIYFLAIRTSERDFGANTFSSTGQILDHNPWGSWVCHCWSLLWWSSLGRYQSTVFFWSLFPLDEEDVSVGDTKGVWIELHQRRTPKENASVASEYSRDLNASGAIQAIGPKFCFVVACSSVIFSRANPKSHTYTSEGFGWVIYATWLRWHECNHSSGPRECYGQLYLCEPHVPVVPC